MKVILYMGISANGIIAKSDGNSEFTSDEDLQGFFSNAKRIGNVVMGANTLKEASRQGYFPFPGALNVVMTKNPVPNTFGDRVVFTPQAPEEVLAMLENKGFESVFLIGGGMLNSSFLSKKLIDEIYLDVEPLVLGRGIPVFAPADIECDLELLEVTKLNANTVQLHYSVTK